MDGVATMLDRTNIARSTQNQMKSDRRHRQFRHRRLSVESLESRQMLAADTLTATEVRGLLTRASAASTSNDGIIAVVDRRGAILGVRVE